jgi:hypothetical protein
MNIEFRQFGVVIINYKHQANPLSAKDIQLDIHDLQRRHFDVTLITLWNHQWLWLLHEAGLINEARLPWVPVPKDEILIGKNTIWGVDVLRSKGS